MTNTQSSLSIGDPVLVDFDGAQIPGVVENQDGNRYQVRLAEPWADETGHPVDSQWLSNDRLTPEVSGTDIRPELSTQ